MSKENAPLNLHSGISATHSGQTFYFYTNSQNEVERAMYLMGFDNLMVLDHFENRPQPSSIPYPENSSENYRAIGEGTFSINGYNLKKHLEENENVRFDREENLCIYLGVEGLASSYVCHFSDWDVLEQEQIWKGDSLAEIVLIFVQYWMDEEI